MSITLILGGARSGKSAVAERLAQASQQPVSYIATCTLGDGEISERISQHRERRPADWRTVEEPLLLADVIRCECSVGRTVLVDCLTLWLSNLMLDRDTVVPEIGSFTLPARFDVQRDALLDLLAAGVDGELLLVSNEVGMGIVPMGALARRFADEAGHLHQAIAARADRVILVAAGLPLTLKGTPC